MRQLGQSDAQLFAGWGGHASVNDVTVIEKLSQLSQRAAELLKVSHIMNNNNNNYDDKYL